MSVVVAYIPTSEGFTALELAIVEARFRETSIVVVNVAVNANFADVTFADDKDLDAVRARVEEAGLAVEIVQRPNADDVATAVLEVADDVDAQLIVVALRRRSPVGKVLLGSNAQKIILSAPCPVLSVRPAIDA